MITFDKLKLVADISAVVGFDEGQFEKTEKNGFCTFKHYQEVPYLLAIKIDYPEKEVVLEFTGKVLGSDYPKLISMDTIQQCFQAINSLGIITLDIDAMMDAEVVKCDVTKDIRFDDIPSLTNYVRQHISNYHRYVCRRLRNNNLVVEKNVTSRKTKKRMTIYDKGKEMLKVENRRFSEAYGLEGAFDGICRFELNLNTKEQIRNSLAIGSTKLQEVLSSNANPIADFLDDVIEDDVLPSSMTDRKTYVTMLILKDCDYDLEKVEAKMRQLYPSRGSNISTIMQPYRQMMEQLNSSKESNLWENVRQQICS
ncbi:MAG: hypothetical protein IJ205_07205 [Bacteroidales bacterium]|nr:hypothetical protein [Bacteroidales bacterium]